MITKSDYEKLCKFCDKVLLDKDATNNVISNTSLHIIREHPAFLQSYKVLFTSSRIIGIKDNILLFFRGLLVSIYRSVKSLFDAKWWHAKNEIKSSDIIFVSHLINKKILSQDNDFYFHDIPSKLDSLGVRSTVILINHIKLDGEKEKNLLLKSPLSYVLLSPTLNFISEVKLYLAQLGSIGLLKKIIKRNGVPVNISNRMCVSAVSSDSINALRISEQVSRLIKDTRPKYLFLTYEGHAWERLVFHEAKKVDPKIKCIGYQHAAISKAQHSVRRLLHDTYNPDVILTAGKVSERQLKSLDEMSNIPVICLGSSKAQLSQTPVNQNLNTCLVVPEGMVTECIILFEFSMACARSMPDYKFIWRLHPLLSFKELMKKSAIFRNIPENITLSNQSLREDVRKSDTVLYRGSTAVIDAINAGLRPVYMAQENELSIDPIYEAESGKSIVQDVEEFCAAVSRPLSDTDIEDLCAFAREFYMPLNFDVLKDICVDKIYKEPVEPI